MSLPPAGNRTPRRIIHIMLAAAAALVVLVAGLTVYVRQSSESDERQLVARPSSDALAVRTIIRAGLDGALRKDSPTDRRYFSRGVWTTGRTPCVQCDFGPGLVAAAMGSIEASPAYVGVAAETIDAVIRQYRAKNGALGRPGRGENLDISTMFIANQIGIALYILGPRLDPGRRAAWTEALRGATDYLVKNGNYAWYTNGNIAVGNALSAAWTWHATGDPRYRTLYVDALSFATSPPANRWPRRGLVFTRNPLRPDGADGAGYLTEAAGAGRPGFDADYTQIQADSAALIYLITNDIQALRLSNLLVNQLLPRVDRSTWMLDTSRGTRHPEKKRSIPFSTNALSILATRGRPDLRPLVAPQARASAVHLTKFGTVGDYHTWGIQLAPVLFFLR